MSSYAPGTVLPGPHAKGLGATARKDAWWASPLLFFVVLVGFIIYSTWAGLMGAGYLLPTGWKQFSYFVEGTNYLTPFYSPELWRPVGSTSHHAWFGDMTWWPQWFMNFSPAFLILAIPAGFRMTCYYYRKVYYRSFWADPIACAVGEPRNEYWGENRLPLILWNAHRYMLYLAIIVTGFLLYDGIIAFFFPVIENGVRTGTSFGIGLGSIILLTNAFLLMGYTFGCHSFRHLIGGRSDSFGAPGSLKYKLWSFVTKLNEHHPTWAMVSLCWVLLSDIYVRVLAHTNWTEHIVLFKI
jgi:hypothetical protein